MKMSGFAVKHRRSMPVTTANGATGISGDEDAELNTRCIPVIL